MNLARVVGNIWATRKDPSLEESKILIIQPLDRNYAAVGERIAAVDTVGAGPGTGSNRTTSSNAATAVTTTPRT